MRHETNHIHFVRGLLAFLVLLLTGQTGLPAPAGLGNEEERRFLAGASVVDITPVNLPVRVNGGFLERTADRVHDRLNARCLILDDGSLEIAIVVVDTCMMPRSLIDRAKADAAVATGIRPEHMLVSATHAHSAPAAMGCLGSRQDEVYARWLPGRIARAISTAHERRVPARVGWGTIDRTDMTFCRRWVMRSDRLRSDPFGRDDERAAMNPGYQNPDVVAPAGPVDPEISVLSVVADDGKPIGLLANFSMHYFGAPSLSADYFGRFAAVIAARLGVDAASESDPEGLVAMLSQGTSGDSHWRNYGRPGVNRDIDEYTAAFAESVRTVHESLTFHGWVPLGMAQSELTLDRRVPDAERLAWARTVTEGMDGEVPKSKEEVYALEQFHLRDDPRAALILQALRVGDLGVTAIPNEVYGLTGLKIKSASPTVTTMNITLANGAEGYIPPAEHFPLGGYTTWPARTAGLEVGAEASIAEEVIGLLERVSGARRRFLSDEDGEYPRAILGSDPSVYWRLTEQTGPLAWDAGGHGRHGRFEPGVLFHLPGPTGSGISGPDRVNRAAHLAGGRIRIPNPTQGEYTVQFWIWNGFPVDARPVTGFLFGRGADGGKSLPGDQLALGGTQFGAGRLVYFSGSPDSGEPLAGERELAEREWFHVALVRRDASVSVYVDGVLDLSGEAPPLRKDANEEFFLGGRNDGYAGWEGLMDEVAIHERALAADEIRDLFESASRRESR